MQVDVAAFIEQRLAESPPPPDSSHVDDWRLWADNLDKSGQRMLALSSVADELAEVRGELRRREAGRSA